MSAAESLRLESYEVSRQQFPTPSPSKNKLNSLSLKDWLDLAIYK